MSRVLITGANGFVGRALTGFLHEQGFRVRAAVRKQSIRSLPEDHPVKDRVIFDLDKPDNDYHKLLEGVEIVIHLAARVHIKGHSRDDPAAYRRTNTSGSRLLAEQAARLGVKRFVFLSTVKIHGGCTVARESAGHHGFTERDPANPRDPYSISKYEAEQAIIEVCQDSMMEWVILRPPLLYGPGVRANFLQLLRAVSRAYPLPLASINNQRSILFIDNLCNVIRLCLEHPQAANQIFLVSDDTVSVPQLLRKIAAEMGRTVFMPPLPLSLLKVLAVLTGRTAEFARLTQSLVIDDTKLRKTLNWTPPCSLEQGIASTVDWYLHRS